MQDNVVLMPSLPQLALYGRDYCCLCEQMLAALRPLALRLGFDLCWVDIDDDMQLEAQYEQLIPVLVGENAELICCYHVDQRALEAYLSKRR